MATIGLFVHRVARPLEELTGIGRYAVALSHALVARGVHDYVLLAPFDDHPAPGTWPDMPLVRLGGARRVLQARWRLLHRPLLDDLVSGIDLVHSVSPAVPLPTRAPLVTTIHDLFPFDVPGWKSRRGQWLFMGAIAHLRDHGAAVITPSHHVAAQVVRRLGVPADHVAVVPEGVDPRFHDARPDPHVAARLGLPAGYLLALGSVSPRKNLGTVVAALARLPPAARPPLVVAGPDGSAASTLADQVADLQLDGSVHRLGFVDDTDVPALLAGARALVHPSLDEGFGLPVAEALATGTPVLASTAGALPELVGDGGTLLDPHDVAGWASAIAALAVDDGRALAEQARARAATLTWDAAAAGHEDVYARALRQERR